MPLRDDVLSRANARVGTVVNGKWRLDRVLGIGGMATVYEATHRNQKRVAIKMLHPEVSLDQQVTTRFTREGYVANSVGHPSAVSVLDDDVADDGSAFLVMELLEGQTLDALLEQKGPLAPGDVLRIADQLLDVLGAAHAKGILHRDIKPENLFLTTAGELKILDFGIARLRELAAGQTAGSTQSGSLLGTPAFMAPEQARGRLVDIDERTDLWSAAATMYTLLTDRFVHEAETLNEQLIQSATKAADSIARLRPDLPFGIVDRALSYEQKKRFQNAREFQDAIRAAFADAGPGELVLRAPPSIATRIAHETVGAARVAAVTNPSATLTTGRAMMSEVEPSVAARSRVSWVVGALAVVIAVVVLVAMRARYSGGPAATLLANPMPPPSVSFAPPPVEAKLEPKSEPAVSASLEPAPTKPLGSGRPAPKPTTKTKVSLGSQPSREPVPPKPPASDLFEKRH